MPGRMVSVAYKSTVVLLLAGPVVGGGMVASNSGGRNSEWLLLIPALNLVLIVLAVVWRLAGRRTGEADVRLRSGDVMPFLFVTVGMLSLLPQSFLMPLILWLVSPH